MKEKKIVVSKYGYKPVTITISDANALPMEDLKAFLWEKYSLHNCNIYGGY